MKSIKYDGTSGSLRDGMVWEFNLKPFDHLILGDGLVYATFVGGKTEDIVCPLVKEPLLDVRCRELRIALFGSTLGHFLPMADHGFLIISSAFAETLVC